MLLTGTYPRTLDDKKRLVMPRRVREELGEAKKLYVTPGPDQCLWVYTVNGLQQLADKLDRTPATDTEARVFRRLYFAQTEAVDLDRAGRILIPERLMQFAGMQHEVVILGVQDHLEVWDAGKWKAYSEQHTPRFDAVAEAAFRPEK
jgi:MraZ protein